jgi:DNA (cytosine-5)-methyltransferase 1
MPNSPPRFLEFFAGAGLVRQALEPAWRCVWANDLSEKKGSVYRENFGRAELHIGDVADVRAEDLPDADLAWASFPCQDLSLAGWRRGMNSARSGAFWAFWTLMRELKQQGRLPQVLVIENVTGLLQGDDFSGLCEALAALDLRFGALVIDAKRFTPQSRPRVFIVAANTAIAERFGTSDPAPAWTSPTLQRAVERLPVDVSRQWVWWPLPEPIAGPSAIEALIETDQGLWFSESKVKQLLAMMAEPSRRKMLAAAREGVTKVGFLYRRVRQGRQRAEVRFDGIAGCLRTPAGGSSRQTLVLVEGDAVRMRLLTAREAARLMGAPDSFKLPANYNDAYRAMGDGVCVAAVSWLARHLLLPLAATHPAMDHAVVDANQLLHRTQQRADRWFRDRP